MADTLESLEIEVKHSASGAAKEVDALTEAVKGLSKALEPCITRMKEFNSALFGVSGGTKMSSGLSGVSKAASSVKPAMDSAASGVNNLSKAASNSTGVMGNFLSSLKRIAFYRFVRTIIKELTEAFKEGLENAYEYSKAVGGELAPALDRIATASQQMKNQLGAALGELIITLEPILVELIHLITFLAEAFTWLFAVLGGRQDYMYAEEVATAWKEADKSAKEYKRTILGFDVINRLNGDGGTGVGPGDISSTFSRTPAGIKDVNLDPLQYTIIPPDISTGPTMDALGELVDLLEEIFGKQYQLDLGFGWNVDPIPVLEKVKQQLDLLLADSPYTVVIGMRLGEGFRETLEKLWQDIYDKVINPSPVMGEIGWEVTSPVPEMVAIGDGIIEELMRQADAYSKAYQDITEAMNRGVESAQTTAEAMNRATDDVRRHTELLPRTQTSVVAEMVTLNDTLATNQTITASDLKRALGESLNHYKGFSYGSSEAIRFGVGDSANYMVEFAQETARTTGTWASETGQIFADWGTGINTEVADTLDKSYENLKGFAGANGVSLPEWKSKRNAIKNVVVAVGAAALAGLTYGAIKQGAGGIGISRIDLDSQGAYASGGFPTTGQMFVARERGPELVGTIGGQTAVANNDQIVAAVSQGVANAVSGVLGNQNDRPLSVRVYLDSKEIKVGQRNYSRAMGV